MMEESCGEERGREELLEEDTTEGWGGASEEASTPLDTMHVGLSAELALAVSEEPVVN